MKSDISHRRTLPSERGRSLDFSIRNSEAGFSLVETTIALLLMTIVGLGAVSLSLFSIYNNSGGSDRATALAIAQQTLERLRSAQFNQAGTDPTLTGGTFLQMTPRDGRVFRVTKIIDDNPKTSAVDVNSATTLKLITITVESQSIGRGWARGQGGTITLITERTKKNY